MPERISDGSLPARVRSLYRLRYTPGYAAAFTHAVRTARSARPLVPGAIIRGRNRAFFDAVAQTEAARLARGRPTPGLAA